MIIGIPKEVKNHEYRVGATPSIVRELKKDGHTIIVQSDAGKEIGFLDEEYIQAGALIVSTIQEVYSQAEMIVKVKEPQLQECSLLKEGQILFGYLHLAPDPVQTKHLIEKKVIAIAYETVTDSRGRLPLLLPMSEIAGRVSVQAATYYLQLNNEGKGILLGGVNGVAPAKVVIIGAGAAGTEAARMAAGLGAEVYLLDNDLNKLKELDLTFSPRIRTIFSTSASIEHFISLADVVIGSVLIPGKLAPKLITRQMIKKMKYKSVFVDISIDQGGCSETSRPTTHSNPIYEEEGVIHYCVTNMPSACARTATEALTNATFRYVKKLAKLGFKQALKQDSGLLEGLNVCFGKITNRHVAEDLGLRYTSPETLLI